MTTTTSGRTPDPVDLHVGREIAARRQIQGFTQSDLAKALGLTFQQVQKYEKGSNRVSASKLHRIAAFLGNTPGSFFPPADNPNPTEETSAAGAVVLEILNAGGLNLVRDFLSLDHGRREIVRLVARTLTREVVPVDDLAGSSTVLGGAVRS